MSPTREVRRSKNSKEFRRLHTPRADRSGHQKTGADKIRSSFVPHEGRSSFVVAPLIPSPPSPAHGSNGRTSKRNSSMQIHANPSRQIAGYNGCHSSFWGTVVALCSSFAWRQVSGRHGILKSYLLEGAGNRGDVFPRTARQCTKVSGRAQTCPQRPKNKRCASRSLVRIRLRLLSSPVCRRASQLLKCQCLVTKYRTEKVQL